MMTKRFLVFSMLILCILLLNSCYYAGALIMSVPKKWDAEKWNSGQYKVRTQKRQRWTGPHYYQVKVKKKKLGGIYHRKIVKEEISGYDFQNCMFKLPARKDSLTVDVCNKKVVAIP